MMRPAVRRAAFALHLVASVGWIGAVVAYIVLDITVATGTEVTILRAAYIAMDLLARFAIVPLALAAFVTGLVMSLGTKWGLFRHYWVVLSLVLTVLAIGVLLVETRTIALYAATAADAAATDDEIRALGNTLLHSGLGLVVLLTVLALNLYKPRGLTRYGWRKQQEQEARRKEPDSRVIL